MGIRGNAREFAHGGFGGIRGGSGEFVGLAYGGRGKEVFLGGFLGVKVLFYGMRINLIVKYHYLLFVKE